jgi:hypothetical protein
MLQGSYGNVLCLCLPQVMLPVFLMIELLNCTKQYDIVPK